jgi:TetR/AcrR family transcriptional regulator
MVSQTLRQGAEGTSRERLLAAAAGEFAARGFDGAKVDRIARRARVNKAMVYYHFRNKLALYREVLRTLFHEVAERVEAARQPDEPPDAQLRRYIETLASVVATDPRYPAMWLREMAEGGPHLDNSVMLEIRRILDAITVILDDGRRRGVFGEAEPIVVQMGIVAPLLLFAASAGTRERFREVVSSRASAAPVSALVAHLEQTTLAALGPGARPPASSFRPRRSRR